jgi:hypothetical protein
MTGRDWMFFGVLTVFAVLTWGYLIGAPMSLDRQFNGRLNIEYVGTVIIGACSDKHRWGHPIIYTDKPNGEIMKNYACWDWSLMKWSIDGLT